MNRNPAVLVTVPIVTSNNVAYTTGDQVGVVTKVTDALLESKGKVKLVSVVVIDKDKQDAPLDIFFFSEAPTNAVADNAAAAISAAELASKCIGVVSVLAANYADLSADSVATVSNLSLLLKGSLVNSKDLWVLVVIRATKTYQSTSGLTLRLGLEQK